MSGQLQLQGKTAIVTGASRGIGRAITETFVREGARVFICGRKQDTLDAVAAEIGPAVIPVACHVGRDEDIQALLKQAGDVDILVNNAGTNVAQGPALEMNDAQFDKMMVTTILMVKNTKNYLAPVHKFGMELRIKQVENLRVNNY